ncbi:MAG: class I SAM-dependent methyltransferase [Actinomycetota bacterium]
MTCPACGSISTEILLRLPGVPVHVGLLWRTPDEARACGRGDIDLALCETCGYVWNASFDPDRLDYAEDYDNALHHSPKFAAWEADLVAGLVERHDLQGRRIAEIGPGDGRFLAALCLAGGSSGIGFEPGHNPERQSPLVDDADVEIHDAFADADSLRGADVDFVVSRHVLEHIPEPGILTEAIRGGVGERGSTYLEVPNFDWALDRGAFEDLMYEHCGYYTTETLAHLLRRGGFTDVEAAATFDGLFTAAEAIYAGGSPGPDAIDTDIVESIRKRIGMLADRIDSIDAELSSRRDACQTIAAWGGGARAVGLLNLVPSADAIGDVIDVNPRKQGTFVTGTGHAISGPERLEAEPPDAVLVVNPIYLDEIRDMLAERGLHPELLTV